MTEKDTQHSLPELSDADAELLSAYIDDQLSADERRRLDARLADEPFLRSELAALRQTMRWLSEMPQLEAPRNFTLTQAMVADAPPAPQNITPLYRRTWFPLASTAAALVIVVVGLVLALSPQSSNEVGGSQSDSVASVFTEVVDSTLQQSPVSASQALQMTAVPGANSAAALVTAPPVPASAEESAELDDAPESEIASDEAVPEAAPIIMAESTEEAGFATGATILEPDAEAPDEEESADGVGRSEADDDGVVVAPTAERELFAASPVPTHADLLPAAPAAVQSVPETSESGADGPTDTTEAEVAEDAVAGLAMGDAEAMAEESISLMPEELQLALEVLGEIGLLVARWIVSFLLGWLL